MSLYNLPNEILLEIFNYSDIYSLTQLKCVCNRFNLLISEILVKKSNHLLVTNQMSEKFRKRCKPLLSSYNSKFITHYNWINGICKKRKIHEASNHIWSTSCLEMMQNKLLFFNNEHLYAYDRAEDGTVKNNEEDRAIKSCDSQIFAFVCRNDIIISAHQDGIRHWRIESKDNKNYFQLLKHSNVHDGGVDKIDATSQYIVSSSIGGSVKIQKNTHEEGVSDEGNKIFHIYRSWSFAMSIAFDPTETKFASVICHYHRYGYHSSYIIYDINKSHVNEIDAKDGICHQLLWEDPHTILTCYENCIKKMDMRTSKFVRTWDVPFAHRENDLSCIASDNLYTIMTGTFCNQAILWDQRKNVPIQIYNVPDTFNNKVTSVLFDSRHLYISSANYMYELDFKGDNCNHNEIKAIF